jgi:histidinol-phosphate phosphatase family protein
MANGKSNLICLDRDGTINRDDNYYLGSQENWRDLVEFLPGVIEGVRLLNHIKDSEVFIITNQSGVALDMLTEERMKEVNDHILSILRCSDLRVNGWFACPYVDSKYAKKAESNGRKVNPKYICDSHPDLKPNTGLIKKAAESLGRTLDEFNVYVIGDRESDVMLGLRARGHGILISSEKTRELGDYSNVKALEARYSGGKVYIASDFSDAVIFVEHDARSKTD